mmetsp:Transcript_16077/g.36160  ORF Transcript_16077/g.36160 Transcript_16077/m.36160 type:complete len:612 (-) Transcript_16077:275-2110(-)
MRLNTQSNSQVIPMPNVVLLFADDLGYGDVGFNGHPTTSTPHLDHLAFTGKILTQWYSACSLCSASRASLMTGRQYARISVHSVLSAVDQTGLPLEEITVAKWLKEQRGYTTAIFGKWHLGQRLVYLPGNHGFDYYLGIPFSDDMGNGYASPCSQEDIKNQSSYPDPDTHPHPANAATTSLGGWSACEQYRELGHLSNNQTCQASRDDPAGQWLPLVYQKHNITTILEQPVDFTTLTQKYTKFATDFIDKHSKKPFFLYAPFSHVHTTSATQPEKQYAGCEYKNTSRRGKFGDALSELDGIVGAIVDKLTELNLMENTLILMTSDNGPWLDQGLSGGSMGLLTGQYAGYTNTAKGSTWEGGIRVPSFAHWRGMIPPYSRSSEVISSMDVFPTLSSFAGVDVPKDRIIDGRDMSDILMDDGTSTNQTKTKHDFLFHYGHCHLKNGTFGISAVRHGKYKAHFCTSPGLGGNFSLAIRYEQYPLLFDVEQDPSESMPISTGTYPLFKKHQEAMDRIMKAYAMELATFEFGTIVPEPDGPGEGPDAYGLCCDRSTSCYCRDESGSVSGGGGHQSLFNMGTKRHHDLYHSVLGEEQPTPFVTREQAIVNGHEEELM